MSPLELREWRERAARFLRGIGYLGATLIFGSSIAAAAMGDWHGFTHLGTVVCLLLFGLELVLLRARVRVLETIGVKVKVNARLELGEEVEIEPLHGIERPN